MEPAVIVRRPEAGDVAAMAQVASASYRAAFAAILDAGELARRDAASFVARFTQRLADMRLAEVGGRVVGFSLVTGRHLDMLFIDPAAQGSGAGRALLDEAVGRGVNTLECFRDNRLARGFYERAGWRLARAYAREFAGGEHHFVFYALPPCGGGMTGA
jgi:putative acetyltransferase